MIITKNTQKIVEKIDGLDGAYTIETIALENPRLVGFSANGEAQFESELTLRHMNYRVGYTPDGVVISVPDVENNANLLTDIEAIING